MISKDEVPALPSNPPAAPIIKQRKPGKCRIFFEKREDSTIAAIVEARTESELKNDSLYNELLHKLTGTCDTELANEIMLKASNCIPGYDAAGQRNVIYQALADAEPRDAHEARLIAQAAALYAQGMKYLQRAEGALEDGCFDKQGWNSIFMRNATRLLDMHNKTLEALTRYKQRDGQKITVVHQNVNVGGGGKAAIMNNIVPGQLESSQ